MRTFAERKRSSYDAGFFKLKVANFAATSNQWHWQPWCTARILCFNNSFKKLRHFNRYELGFLTYECDVKNDSVELPDLDKKSDSDSTKKLQLLAIPTPQP